MLENCCLVLKTCVILIVQRGNTVYRCVPVLSGYCTLNKLITDKEIVQRVLSSSFMTLHIAFKRKRGGNISVDLESLKLLYFSCHNKNL